jgi:hypothetical protein
MSEISTADRHSPGDGTTLIHGPVVDQTALHGCSRIRDLGLPLLAVAQVEPDQPDMRTTDPR